MFIVSRAAGVLTPAGVKCSPPQPEHGTPDGVRATRDSPAINMELLAEFRVSKFGWVLSPGETQTLESPGVPPHSAEFHCLTVRDKFEPWRIRS
jgi:hypothetical protein